MPNDAHTAGIPTENNLNVMRMLVRNVSIGLSLLLATARLAGAAVYPLPPADVDIIGELQVVEVQPDETLLDIGRRYGVGYEEMQRANPGVSMWIPDPGTKVVVPTRHILPSAPREGLVLNVAEMRLYYYPPAIAGQPRTVETYPVSIGRMDWRTPIGQTSVVAKQKNPSWYPPQSVKLEAAAEGREVPKVVPPGPDNPLGTRVLRLGMPAYLIHGTNNPWGIGMRVTHGCVRMYPEDIENLFERVSVNTPVQIVNEPVKAGWFAGALYLEAHPVLEEHQEDEAQVLREAVDRIARILENHNHHRVDLARIKEAIEGQAGLPVSISRSNI
jgi:L,D-transpeptidase ErfK/SrfK